MSNPHFYVTTTLPYVNAEPHIGFAWEIVEADVIARYQRLLGKKVIFNTGTDEHGQKIHQKAQEAGLDTQTYVDKYAAKFSDLSEMLNLSYDNFIRTTDPHHIKAAQEFWRRCEKNGDIYKKHYTTKYCVGCELEKTDSELENNRCPLHPNKDLELIEEENYFFRFSNYGEKLLELYKNNPEFVKPTGKLNEITAFVAGGLKDFSISRLKEKMPWGIAVPDDKEHVMYVWFDALINYISTLGWPDDNKNFTNYWPGVQLAGKDNLRQQSAMWQAMLMSAGLPNSKKVLINGFISIGGQKMSKSLGNVISPAEMVERYGIDATRYLLINLGTFAGDADVTWDRLDTEFTADLSNGLGNLCSRVAKMCEKNDIRRDKTHFSINDNDNFSTLMNSFELSQGLDNITDMISDADKNLSENKPWKMDKNEANEYLSSVAIPVIIQIATKLQPFMPSTAKKILTHFTAEKISALQPLFPRLEKNKS